MMTRWEAILDSRKERLVRLRELGAPKIIVEREEELIIDAEAKVFSEKLQTWMKERGEDGDG